MEQEVKLFGEIQLKTGEQAFIVDILKPGKSYIADIEGPDGTYTDFVHPEDIAAVMN
ncbi:MULTISPECIES: hypothetical protein [Eubacterium]|uniref:Uncharacterized protein n=1 Tax=Eubacterium limosum TaxID=1736 RepID=A0ABT5UYB7_EUBLI|nr:MULTISPECIES: hypothetical protein [Eubacterium]MBU5306052.1 hypothetical protein [Eubacterium callanderi]MCB6572140.1 hypothetical protein [Eubacterium limosum]MDE1472836.1 hypothetical protein [Eubacterium limosum]